MASKKFKKITIKDTENSNFGNYDEANGGGTPRGGVWGGRSGRVGWQEREDSGDLPEGAHREEQPRTADGKFTYNSVNGKETKYDGRGKTVNPLLTGGENGIKIDDVKSQFSAKSGNLYDKYSGKWYQKGSEKITKQGKKFVTKISSDDVWEIAKYSFDISKGEFGGEGKAFEQSKSGRSNKEEIAAKGLAQKTNQEQFVKTDTGSIKIKGEGGLQKMFKKLKDGIGGSQLKHSPEQIAAVRNLAAQQGLDFSAFTDEQIDQVADDFLTF